MEAVFILLFGLPILVGVIALGWFCLILCLVPGGLFFPALLLGFAAGGVGLGLIFAIGVGIIHAAVMLAFFP